MSDGQPTVLIVDDEPDLADLYAAWLADSYDVRTAYGGDDGIDAADEDVDVALIDRLMPDTSGDEVLSAIRAAGYGCRVAMVTAVEPDFDIIEMGFDDYLVKPVRREELREAVEQLLSRSEYDAQLREYYALVSKRAALETQKSERELEESEAYAELCEDIEELSVKLDETTADFTTEDFERALQELEDN
ncbi:HalX domain-containing protein [Halosegnis longus]|uniref:Response regulator n=1 Tax=Halosegnis longus TaxID=2216012 RepID=A0AAJ4R6Q7_9EURY|nr:MULTISPECIES: HalX domain-containing protein [Halobacteriales]RNJ25290.1 response regulator [Salella cibi]